MAPENDSNTDPLNDFVNRRVHVHFSHPARVHLGRTFEDHGSVRIEAVDGTLARVTATAIVVDVEVVYPSRGDIKDPGVGIAGYQHRCTIVQPTKYLGSVCIDSL